MGIFFGKERTIRENRLIADLIAQKIPFATEGPSYICPITHELIDDGNHIQCPYSHAIKCIEEFGGLEGGDPDSEIRDPEWMDYYCELHEQGRCPYESIEEQIRRYGKQ